MAQSPLTNKQKAAMRKKVATGAAKVMKKAFYQSTADKQKGAAMDARKRVKALVGNLTPAKRKAAIKNLQARKRARALKASKT